MPTGWYIIWCAIQSKTNPIAAKRPKPGSKEATLSYRVIGKSDNYFLLEINLETGTASSDQVAAGPYRMSD